MEQNKRKKRISMIWKIGMVCICATVVTIVSILFYAQLDIQSKVPIEILEQNDVSVNLYHQRNIFIVKNKEPKREDRVLLYLHGGSYIAELKQEHWEFVQEIVQETDATVIIPDYPLAPKYGYTDVFSMLLPLYQQILKKVPGEHLILLGDSAGGGMALGLLEKVGELGYQLPQKTIVISPWLDISLSNPAIGDIQKYDKSLDRNVLKIAGLMYAEKKGTQEYLVSPLLGPVQYLQNVTVFTGTNDILNPDVAILQQKVQQAGGMIQIKQTPHAMHNWIIQKYVQEEVYRAQEDFQELIKVIQREE